MTGATPVRHPAVEPSYFGDPSAPLFGCLHRDASSARGVVICQPVLHEYVACHRAVKQLASRLVPAGFAALRFDFYGAGDSAGASEDGTPRRWQQDIDRAMHYLQSRTGRGPVSLIGVRLGATLAVARQAEPDAPEVPSLVLWDPVVDGAAYVAELLAAQRESFGASEDEVLGFPFDARLRADLEAIDLRRGPCPRARRILVVDTGGSAPDAMQAMLERFRAGGGAVEHRTFDAPPMWRDAGKTIVPGNVVQGLVSWMKGT